MKISASIYSDKKTDDILSSIKALDDSHVDMIHVDCNDDLNVFFDIEKIQQNTTIPIDLHIITEKAERFYPALENFDIEYVTFQYEDLLDKKLAVPKEFSGQLGLAITTNTEIDVFEDYADEFDFILFMATVPGQSGGKFDPINFRKIRSFQQKYPDKKVHVDGGVNAEVSFILRNMGVYASVSGSYLFNSTNINTALLNLKLNEIDSHFMVRDFMRDLDESPVVKKEELTLENVLNEMDKGKMGFVMVTDGDGVFEGIIGNADVRRGLLNNIGHLNDLDVRKLINTTPVSVKGSYTVHQLLRYIKNQSKTVMYLPVLDDNNKCIGSINFMNLIKGEL